MHQHDIENKHPCFVVYIPQDIQDVWITIKLKLQKSQKRISLISYFPNHGILTHLGPMFHFYAPENVRNPSLESVRKPSVF